MAGHLSKGTRLEINNGTIAAPAWVKVGGLKSWSGFGAGSPSIQDSSDLDSVAKEKLAGLIDEGQGSTTHNYLPTDAGQKLAWDSRGTEKQVRLNIPNGKSYTGNAIIMSAEPSGATDTLVDFNIGYEFTGSLAMANAVA